MLSGVQGDHRVAVSELIPEDLSGGYIMKHDNDNYGPDEATIRTPTTGLVHIFRYPRRPSREARAWLTDWLDAFDRALVSDDFKDEERGYRAFADVPSFVDYQLAVEFTKNPDGEAFLRRCD